MDLVKNLIRNPVVWFGLLFFLAFGWVGEIDFEDAIQADAHYCKMVRLYKESDGTVGWPDYEQRYERDCLDSDPR